MNGPESIALITVVGFAGSTVFVLARAIARRIEGKGRASPALSSDAAMRMERMERAIESVAIEVERISEGQRYLTRVLADPGRAALSPPAQQGRS
jgi:hypothetical protein